MLTGLVHLVKVIFQPASPRAAVRSREDEDDMTEALVGLGLMMVLALLRIPIAIAMGVVGFLGVAYLRDWNFAPAMAMVETKVYETGATIRSRSCRSLS